MIILGEVGARINSCQSFRFRLAFRLVSVFGIGNLLFGSIVVVCLTLMYKIYSQKKDSHPPIKYLFERGVMTSAVAIAVWLIDLQLCDYVNGKENSILPFNPQLHAVWHILASIGLYLL